MHTTTTTTCNNVDSTYSNLTPPTCQYCLDNTYINDHNFDDIQNLSTCNDDGSNIRYKLIPCKYKYCRYTDNRTDKPTIRFISIFQT